MNESFEHLNPHGADHDRIRAIRDRLAIQSRVVLRLGQMLLGAGAGSYRVKSSMAKLAKAVGLEEHHAQVTFTEIATSAYAHGTFRTEVAEQRAMGINADRIDSLREFVQDLPEDALAEDIDRQLDVIESKTHLYNDFLNAAAAGVACAGFAFLNRGGLVECLVVMIAAFFGQALRRQLLKKHLNHFGVWLICGIVAATIYMGIIEGLVRSDLIIGAHQSGYISAVLFLVPGFPLVTGILDLVRMDFSSGISRLVYVGMLVVSAGIAVWLTSAMFHWSVEPIKYQPVDGPLLFWLRIFTSFIAAFGFAMLFNARPMSCLYAAIVGAFTNTGRLIMLDTGFLNQAAVGLAALMIGLLAAMISAWSHYKYSRVSLSVPAVVIMIPGVPLYTALAHLNEGEFQGAMNSLVQVLFVVVAIGVGLAISRMLTDKGWAIDHSTARIKEVAHLPMR